MIKDNFRSIAYKLDDTENTALVPSTVNNANLDAMVGIPPLMPMMPYCSPNHCLEAVGLNLEQAQKLNFIKTLNAINFEHKVAMMQLALNFKYQKKLIDGTFKENSRTANLQAADNKIIPAAVSTHEIQYSVEEFLTLNFVIKLRSRTERSGWIFYVKNGELNRHTASNEKSLCDAITDYLWEKYPDRNLPQSMCDKIIKSQIRRIQRLDQSCLHPLSDVEIVFNNGVYDFNDNNFTTVNEAIFARFSLPINFVEDFTEPLAFNAMLNDIFNGDETTVTLLYEVFGAILANKNTLKKIFLFQGASNGGKTRLAEILLRCLDFDDHADFNTISDITNDSLEKESKSLKLIYLKDISDRKLGSNQISYLKSYADGGHGDSAASFKILAAANGAIISESDGSVSPALRNRLLVVPFAKPMDNSDPQVAAFEDMYLTEELPHIVRKALQAFGEVLRRGGKFIHEYELNAVLDTHPSASPNDADVTESLRTFILENFTFSDTPCTTAEEIYTIVNDFDPTLAGSPSALSKKLGSLFKEQFKRSRQSDITYFNLAPLGK